MCVLPYVKDKNYNFFMSPHDGRYRSEEISPGPTTFIAARNLEVLLGTNLVLCFVLPILPLVPTRAMDVFIYDS